jgi:hypothetical protein
VLIYVFNVLLVRIVLIYVFNLVFVKNIWTKKIIKINDTIPLKLIYFMIFFRILCDQIGNFFLSYLENIFVSVQMNSKILREITIL